MLPSILKYATCIDKAGAEEEHATRPEDAEHLLQDKFNCHCREGSPGAIDQAQYKV
jgi:hypothetical protein